MSAQERSRRRSAAPASAKVPLTYYRSSPAAAQSTRSPFRRAEAKPGKFHRVIVNFVDVIVVAAIIFGIGYSLIVTPHPIIKANDYSYHSATVYRQAAAKLLGGVKNHTKMTFDETSVTSRLMKDFPEISTASVELPLIGQQPIIHLTIAKPVLRLTGNGQSYVVDSDGVAVARIQDLPGIKHLPAVDDQTGFNTTAGRQALSSAAVGFIGTILAQCRRAHVPIKSLTLPPAPLELDLRTADKPYFVKFYLGGDALAQTGDFLAARHRFTKGSGPSQYLDVRVSGKVFYK